MCDATNGYAECSAANYEIRRDTMKLIWIVVLLISLTGCHGQANNNSNALQFRQMLNQSNGCSFYAVITADYKDIVHTFEMDCMVEQNGDLSFTVAKPDTIAGITGRITASGGALTFDDRVLSFETIADGLLSPVIAPWILVRALRSGYVAAESQASISSQALIHDSYRGEMLELDMTFTDGLPVSAEIIWENYRYLTVSVDSFSFV